MRRAVIIGACVALLPTASAHAARARPLPARATLDACHPSLNQAQRYAVFGGSMHSLRNGRDRMDMRFDLYRRLPGASSYERVTGPGLGVYDRAARGVIVFRFRQKVENMSAPADYRAVVSFRWLNSAGRVFARAKRITPVCHQLDLRPDLRIGRITATRLTATSARYDVSVRNDGRSRARDFDVVLTVNGSREPAITLSSLAAGTRQIVSFTAPECAPTRSLSVAVDPDNRVSEADETNNVATVPCPLGAGG